MYNKMNRGAYRRQAKNFVRGGVYDARQNDEINQQNAQVVVPLTPTPPAQIQNQAPTNQEATLIPIQLEQAVKPTEIPQKIKKEDEIIQEKTSNEETVSEDIKIGEANGDTTITADGAEDDERFKFKKIFQRRKKSSVRQKEKKIRQNRQLRKIIIPKNALMALNEVKGIVISDFIVNSNTGGGGFTAIVTVNNKQFEGRGNSKVAAKNDACEKALRDYVLNKMRESPRSRRLTPPPPNATEPMDTSESNDLDGAESMKSNGTLIDETEDVPMVNLASFALYKLFTDWENDGFIIPELHPSGTNVPPSNTSEAEVPIKEPKKPTIRNELPMNWETMHPATLLCMMRPGLTYEKGVPLGERPNIFQTISINVEDQQFIAMGRSLKLARRNAAVKVCNTLFGTNFTEE